MLASFNVAFCCSRLRIIPQLLNRLFLSHLMAFPLYHLYIIQSETKSLQYTGFHIIVSYIPLLYWHCIFTVVLSASASFLIIIFLQYIQQFVAFVVAVIYWIVAVTVLIALNQQLLGGYRCIHSLFYGQTSLKLYNVNSDGVFSHYQLSVQRLSF